MRRNINMDRPFVGGPLDGETTTIKCAYIDPSGKRIYVKKAEEWKRSGKFKMYFHRGDFYEWKEGTQ
jgi:hypothetical protein